MAPMEQAVLYFKHCTCKRDFCTPFDGTVVDVKCQSGRSHSLLSRRTRCFVEMVHKQGLEYPLELRDEQDVVQAVSG